MRRVAVLLHRYVGLAIAAFLVVVGLTGSLLAFYQGIDHSLNPGKVFVPVSSQPMLDPLVLRDRAQTLFPDTPLTWVELRQQAGKNFHIWVDRPRQKYIYVRLNPYTGEEVFRLPDSYWPISRSNFMDVVYDLHWRLLLPGSTGIQLLGIVALVWTLDCFVGLALTMPRGGGTFWRQWRAAWRFRRTGSVYQRQFSWHRALGLWAWVMLFALAWSAVAFNLGSAVYQPVMHRLTGMQNPSSVVPVLASARDKPLLDWVAARDTARRLMQNQAAINRFSVTHEQSLSYDAATGTYRYAVRSSRDVAEKHGATALWFDGDTGQLDAVSLPTGDNAGQSLTSWISALHMADKWGLCLQIVVSLTGIGIVYLASSGVYLWLRKRRARQQKGRRNGQG
jgi:uncharacterized iron-regulated membrane protein